MMVGAVLFGVILVMTGVAVLRQVGRTGDRESP